MKKDTISVAQLTRQISDTLKGNIGTIAVEGELSNFKAHSSGHRYFTLKDDSAQISCTMWRSRTLNFEPKDGMSVIVRGNITVYAPRGSYQIECSSMQPLGQGDLYLAFEQLKEKLREQGYFDIERKRPLPRLPMAVGVATSATGAAVRDILTTLERRFPAAVVYFRPTVVQGEAASPDIAHAISELNETDADVLIVGRGGGSLEDLWAFNTEPVAEAIFNSRIPVVSAVGHETDFTIADFVADVRAATPTAAAELVTQNTKAELLAGISNLKEQMSESIKDIMNDLKLRIDEFYDPTLLKRISDKISTYRQLTDESTTRMRNSLSKDVATKKNSLAQLRNHLMSMHPLNPLKRGFAILKHNGKLITQSDSLKDFTNIEIERADETAKAMILNVKNKSEQT